MQKAVWNVSSWHLSWWLFHFYGLNMWLAGSQFPDQGFNLGQGSESSESFFRELEQIISQFVWKYKKTSNSQRNLEKEEWNWRNQPAWLQTILQSHSYQDSMVLAQREKYRSMEQNRKPRDKSMHLWTTYLWQRRQEYTMEKRQSL